MGIFTNMVARNVVLGALVALMTTLVLSARKVVLTGGTGTLGSAICRQLAGMLDKGHAGDAWDISTVYVGYRNVDRLEKTLQGVHDGNVASRDVLERTFLPFPCKFPHLSGTEILPYLQPSSSTDRALEEDEVVIINNAGVCISGSSRSALQESLDINTIYPIRLARGVLFSPLLESCDVTVVNVSSGDGELTWLHSDLAAAIEGINTFVEWHNFVGNERDNWRGEGFEYAYGDTPMYSVSKALLNAGTRVLHEGLSVDCRVRKIISVCPGNFPSPMSTEEEIKDASSPDEAAASILSLLSSPATRSGKFYRNGEEVEW